MAGRSVFFDLIKQHDVKFVDFRFTDSRGMWHHTAQHISTIDESLLSEGVAFDGSSIVGWRAIHESDMLLIPDLTTAVMDPFAAQPTLIVFCDVYDPLTKGPYDRDPRSIAKKAEIYLRSTGLGEVAYFGPEAEFFIFDGIRFDVTSDHSFFEIDSDELPAANQKPFSQSNHGHRPGAKGGYFPVPPIDSASDMRAEMVLQMQEMGVDVEKHHHEVAPAQHELGIKYSTLVQTADRMQIYKYVVKQVAHMYGKTATFMPKPVYGDNGSGMHIHMSVWKNKQPLFAGDGYAGLSDFALHYIGGILKHARAINAFTNPTTNSYKRLIPGFEAPVILVHSQSNRSASCRIPHTMKPAQKRIEIRFPDATANPYLAFAALLMAGIDGVKNKITPGAAMDQDLYHADSSVVSKLPTVCGSLRESLTALQNDHEFLLQGDVFTQSQIEGYLEMKWREVYALDHAPHPLEFKLYYSS